MHREENTGLEIHRKPTRVFGWVLISACVWGNPLCPGKEPLNRIRENHFWSSHRARNSSCSQYQSRKFHDSGVLIVQVLRRVVLVKVLERERKKESVCEEIYCKELPRVIMEADRSHNLQGESARWRLRRANGVAIVQRLTGSRPRQSQCFGLSLKAAKSWCLSLKAVRQEEFSSTQERVRFFVQFRPLTDWMGLTHIREAKLLYAVCQTNVWPKIWAPMAQSSWHIMLIITKILPQ